MKKRGQKRVRISDPFLGPFSIGTLSTGPKNGPISGSEFWEAGYRHDPHFGARFWSRKIWARIKNQCHIQSDNPDVASSSICSTAAKKQVQACCMYTLILTRCSNCGGPLCTTTFSKGLFGLVNEPAQPSKIEDHSVEDDFNRSCTVPQPLSIADASTMTGSSRLSCRALFRRYLVLYRPKEGKGQGTAGWSATLQDFRQNTSLASKEYPDMGTEFGCKICILCADT